MRTHINIATQRFGMKIDNTQSAPHSYVPYQCFRRNRRKKTAAEKSLTRFAFDSNTYREEMDCWFEKFISRSGDVITSATDDALLLTNDEKHNRHRGRHIRNAYPAARHRSDADSVRFWVQSDTVDVEDAPNWAYVKCAQRRWTTMIRYRFDILW